MDINVNVKYRDRLFRHLFGSPDRKEELLSLYNALNNTNYENAEDLEIYTIEDVIYVNMKNDVSLLLDGTLSLFEHQSTINPNMPLRGLCYFARMYERFWQNQPYKKYSTSILRIPTPQYYVFYNGDDSVEDKTTLKLSKAFIREAREGEFEWTATMLNINYGHNKELMDKCKTLHDYATLVDKVKYYNEENPLEPAIDNAVKWCIENDVLAEYLRVHRGEVVAMMLTEYNEEEARRALREEAIEQGHAEGLERGLAQAVDALKETMHLSVEDACKALKITVEDYNRAKLLVDEK